MLHLIYVDDNPDDYYVIKKSLQKISLPIEFKWLKSGTEFLNYLQQKEPYTNRKDFRAQHVVLLDVNMPEIDGFEVLAKVKEKFKEKVSKVPIIMFSSSNQPEDIEKSLSLGASDYLVKPSGYLETCSILEDLFTKWGNIQNTPENCL